MAQLIKRLGKGKWKIHHNGRFYERKIKRIINKNAVIEWWVSINGRKYMVR